MKQYINRVVPSKAKYAFNAFVMIYYLFFLSTK